MNSPAEAELIARCRQGRPEAWDELFDRHYAATARFVWQLGSDLTTEDIEEICQEVFLTIVKSLASFTGRSQFRTWLFRIAANKAHDYRERQRAAKRGGGQIPLSLHAADPDHGLSMDPPSSVPGPDAQLMQTERLALVDQALQQLDPSCREMIHLRYFGDLSYEEIGQSLDLNPKTVSSRLSRCLDRLENLVREVFAREKITPFSV